MQTIEIEDGLAAEISKIAKSKNKSLTEFVNSFLRENVREIKRQETDEEKLKRYIESYEKFPQQPEEYEDWEEIQDWGDE